MIYGLGFFPEPSFPYSEYCNLRAFSLESGIPFRILVRSLRACPKPKSSSQLLRTFREWRDRTWSTGTRSMTVNSAPQRMAGKGWSGNRRKIPGVSPFQGRFFREFSRESSVGTGPLKRFPSETPDTAQSRAGSSPRSAWPCERVF